MQVQGLKQFCRNYLKSVNPTSNHRSRLLSIDPPALSLSFKGYKATVSFIPYHILGIWYSFIKWL
jgi:hypothetical protein